MTRTRAADDFASIRARLEELRGTPRPKEDAAPAAAPGAAPRAPGHRGPCACGLSLFSDECDGSCKAL